MILGWNDSKNDSKQVRRPLASGNVARCHGPHMQSGGLSLLAVLVALTVLTTVSAGNDRAGDRSVNPLRSSPGEPEAIRTGPISPEPSQTGENSPSAAAPRGPAGPLSSGPQTAAEVPPGEAQGPAVARVPVAADGADQGAPTVGQNLTKEGTLEQIKRIEESTALDAASKAEILKRLKSAGDWIVAIQDSQQKAAQYLAELKQVPSAEALRQELAKPQPERVVEIPPGVSLADLEKMAADVEVRLAAAQRRLEQREEEIKRRVGRKAELAKLIEETRRRVEEAEKLDPVAAGGSESPELAAARRMEASARIRALQSLLQMYTAESQRLDAYADALPLLRDQAKREKNLVEKESQAYQELVSRYRRVESERQAREARRQVEQSHPALRTLAEQVAALAEKRKVLAESVNHVTRDVKANEQQLEQIKSSFANAQDKVDKGGHSTTVGLMLRKLREELPSVRSHQQAVARVAQEMPRANLERLELEEQRSQLADLDVAVRLVVEQLANGLTGSDAGLMEPMEPMVRELLESKRDLLDRLDAEFDAYLNGLSELEISNRALIGEVRRMSAFIDEHVLWIRSADMLHATDFRRAIQGLLLLSQPALWVDLAASTGIDTFKQPVMAISVLLGAALLLLVQARLRARLNTLCQAKSATTTLRFLPTLEGLAIAGVLAIQWPLLWFFFGWRMTTAERTTALGLALGPALQYAACLYWFSEFVRHLCRAGGIAESHLGWSPRSLAIVRREVRWVTFLGLPLATTAQLAQFYDDGSFAGSLGRLAFVGAMLVLAGFFHAMFGAKENVLREAVASGNSPWLARVRWMMHFAGVGLPLGLALLAALGYYYSAQQLAFKLQATVALVATTCLLHSVVARWFLVRRRNLAILQMKQRQQQSAAAENNPLLPVGAKVSDQQPDLTLIHDKLMLLLRHAVTVSVLLGAWFIWADVLPALRALDQVVLWDSTVEVAESIPDASGTLITQRVPKLVPTTLRHLLLSAMLIVATFAVGRNLPALLEFTVLNRLPLDRGARHAVSVISHYTVALTGLLLACHTMNVNWSSVQWLAAGMTVGLGFGLQEVFANFVSGLILLFERPIRVGDVLTLGDVTGVVTDIRIRATTLTNWDRKELIVPNKELITGRLLNWTLSDTTNRIVIAVGVAYRSDPNQVRELLLEVLNEHPTVLTEPAPNATFEGFGDSALQFTIRAFVSTMDVRLATIHELHASIHRRLKEADIEIAFPQRDINVRQVPAELTVPFPVAALTPRTLPENKDGQAEAA